jgi:hypothetical protein
VSDSSNTFAEVAVWAAGLAVDDRGVPRPPMRDVVCVVCGDHSLRAVCLTEAPIEQWAATHARHTGHRDFLETTVRRYRAVVTAYEPQAVL